MNKTEEIAEEIIKIAYNNGGLVWANQLTEKQRKATEDNAINHVMRLSARYKLR